MGGSRRGVTAIVTALALVVFGAISVPVFIGLAVGQEVGACSDANVTVTDPTQVGDLDSTQTTNAQTIIAVGAANDVPVRGWVVALATAMQESTMRNIDYGDRDSVGLFQQRTSTGWGTLEQIQDPVLSAEAFYGVAEHTSNPGLLDIAGWENMPVTEAAQAVQRSAFPDAYAQWEQLARQLVANLDGTIDVSPSDCAPDGAWVLPVGAGYTLTSLFGECGGIRVGRCHTGLDFAAPIGTPIVASAGGTVDVVDDLGGASYGRYVVLTHADGVQTYYAHLDTFAAGITPGQSVTAGTPLGGMGSTGNSTGPHLHFEVRQDGVTIDPLIWLTDRGLTP